jgi:hypothetical protein
MALWGKDKSADQFMSLITAQIEQLKDENQHLRKQVEKLQEALIAKESPLAYRDLKADQAAVSEPQQDRNIDIRLVSEFMAAREKDLFVDVDDLVSALGQLGGAPQAAPVGDGEEG